VISHSEDRLYDVELPPFVVAIASGVDSVMSAHLMIPCWDAQLPATLSHKILTGQLREKLGFDGLITTDALVMGAIANHYGAGAACVMAVEAGADILMMPIDPEQAIEEVCKAVESGRIPRSRIRESVERIWQAKAKIFPPQVGTLDLLKDTAQNDAFTAVTEILQHSQVIHGSVISAESLINAINLNSSLRNDLLNIIVIDDLLNCDFLDHQAPAITLPSQKGYTTQIVDKHTPAEFIQTIEHLTLLQIFIRGNPFRGSAGLTQLAEDLLKKLLINGNLQALVMYGSPYTLKRLIPLLGTDTPIVFSYGQMSAAQDRALCLLFGI
jgi:beta-glucosidase